MGIVFWLSALPAIVIVLVALDTLVGERQLDDLRRVTPLEAGPTVSVIVAARNEAAGIEHALTSLLALDYPQLELIVVNDRSTDQTGAVLGRLTRRHPKLTVVTVETLPPGWLGKNHALALGASRARGEVLLFTDADIVFEPSIVGRAVRLMEQQSLDHLTSIPNFVARGVPLTTLVLAFGVLFTFYTRPWKARDPKSRHHIGIGAFNMVRRTAYERLGTHAAIALRVDDDLRLGRAVKASGLRQNVAIAAELLTVEWYPSVRAMIDGLMKNAFAGVHYSVVLVVLSTLAMLGLYVWPWVALGMTSGAARAMAAVAVVGMSAIVFRHARGAGRSPFYVLTFPLGVLGFVYILWRSAALALVRGSINWRGTSYPLADLRRATPAPILSPGTSRPDNREGFSVHATTMS